MRRKYTLRNFSQGSVIKGDYVASVGNIRLRGWKFGPKLETLTSRGGLELWAPAAPITNILGFKRWYEESGGSHLVHFLSNGEVYGLRFNDLNNFPSFGTYTESFNRQARVLFTNCGSVLVITPLTQTGRPYSLRIDKINAAVSHSIQAKLLGLDAPTDNLSFQTGLFVRGTNMMEPEGIDNGTYLYAISYSYGTRDNPSKYGESALGNVLAVTFIGNSGAERSGIIQINGLTVLSPTSLVQRINIYRTKKNQTGPFYRVGQMVNYNESAFNDTMHDDQIDTSLTAPTQTGIAKGMRVAFWHPTLRRLFWWGEDGYLHFSAAGFPDINPVNSRLEVGNIGYKGNGFALIRDNLYGFKEDGIFLISGSAPNYVGLRINEVGCFARGSVVQAGNGLVFYVGREGDRVTVNQFDGNNAQRIDDQILDILPYAKSSILNNVAATVVGDELHLALTISDPRYSLWKNNHNNVILFYNYRVRRWTEYPAQAGCIEWLNGPGDSGEVYISESDPGTNRGNFFRWFETGWYNNQTTFITGIEAYNNIALNDRSIFLGNIVADTKDLQDVSSISLDVVYRGYEGANPAAVMYSDSRMNDNVIMASPTIEVDKELLKVPTSGLFGGAGALYGTSVFQPTYAVRRRFNLKDDFMRTGFSLDLKFPISTVGRLIEIEAIEIITEPSTEE